MKYKLNTAMSRGISLVLALSTVTVLLSGCGRCCSRSKPSVIQGPLNVTYEIQQSETAKESVSGKVQEIQIFDQCVVIIHDKDGKIGSILPITKLNGLGWTKQ